ncbi:MarR family transporter transcriptional regulator [Legionella quinlivanii]|uniref:MarR family transporter transcriptional regulator n=1 Tax=Legionella quinlivanii TaxID=45073 RepID=A0A0W0Y5D9_9GAMM|nr:MarR family transcriptional regulator [Legionella quinlivanii]KTD51862.1 MarR family transporter transcriptional regulator [Legionella quinlivanii]MCW8452125.1 MarR family transcriptional regulator [Legionella quinlivanii]SEF83182.1 MarR family transcriptional regulator, transcriptional regulator for hemolysin [Legionella quinlivanii DSM 21216]STY09677.1 transcriptional regulator [Legionella quinlivanii]
MYSSTLIKKASRLLIKRANELLKPYGLTDAYTYFLMALYQQDGLTQSEMHKQIGIEQPTAVRTLDRMERDGLIIRTRSPKDRRAIEIRLTEKGRNCQRIIEQCACELNQFALSGFKEEEKHQIKSLLERLNNNF